MCLGTAETKQPLLLETKPLRRAFQARADLAGRQRTPGHRPDPRLRTDTPQLPVKGPSPPGAAGPEPGSSAAGTGAPRSPALPGSASPPPAATYLCRGMTSQAMLAMGPLPPRPAAALRCAVLCAAVLCCALPARSASPRGAGGAARPRGGARGRGLALTATRPAAEGPREAGSAALPREGKARRSGDPRASGPGRAGPLRLAAAEGGRQRGRAAGEAALGAGPFPGERCAGRQKFAATQTPCPRGG